MNLDALIFGVRQIAQAGVTVFQRSVLNFTNATVADNPGTGQIDVTFNGAPGGSSGQVQYNSAGSLAGMALAYAAGVLTNTFDSKLTIQDGETHQATSSTTTTTIYTLALASFNGIANLIARVYVTDSTGANTGHWVIDAAYKVAAGVPTNTAGSTATNGSKSGTIAGTEVTLVISGTNVLVKVTAPSASALTWSIHFASHLGAP